MVLFFLLAVRGLGVRTTGALILTGGLRVWEKLCEYMSLPIFSFLNLSYFSFSAFRAAFSSSVPCSPGTMREGLRWAEDSTRPEE